MLTSPALEAPKGAMRQLRRAQSWMNPKLVLTKRVRIATIFSQSGGLRYSPSIANYPSV
jgi:hypothetical protein